MADPTESITVRDGTVLLNKRHPMYSTLEPEWLFFEQSYKGGREYIEQNLFRYFKEGSEEFKSRKARAYRENHSKRVIDLVNSYLFKEQAKRQTEDTRLQEFHANIDGTGKSIGWLMRQASLWASVFGRIYLIVDKVPLPEEQRTGTALDDLDPNAQPYCYLVFPKDVLDFALDKDGDVKWALVREFSRKDDDPFTAETTMKEQYRLWELGRWTLFDSKGFQIDEGVNSLTSVPLVYIDNEVEDKWSGQSLITDISNLDRAIFNNWSRLDVIVNEQTFSQLIFPVEGLVVDDTRESKDLQEKFLKLAVNRVLLYSAAAQVAPCFISPDASQAQFILEMITRQTKQLFASIGLQNETGEEIKSESGVAKAFDFDKLGKLLATKADNLEEAENKINDFFGQWTGNSINCEIDYPDDFDVRSLQTDIEMAQALAMLDISQTFTRELLKTIVNKALPKLPKDVQNLIMREIDARKEADLTKTRFDFDGAGAGDEE